MVRWDSWDEKSGVEKAVNWAPQLVGRMVHETELVMVLSTELR